MVAVTNIFNKINIQNNEKNVLYFIFYGEF